MIEFKQITIEDKDLFDNFFSTGKYETSEFTFTNLFMWRKSYMIRYAIIDEMLVIMAQYKQDPPFILLPLGEGNLAGVLTIVNDYFKQLGHKLVIKALTEGMLKQLEVQMPDKFSYYQVRDIFDYIYAGKDLINLEGKKFHAKRNHINKFLAQNEYTYHSLTPELIPECMSTAEEWCRKRNCDEDEGLEEEKNAILDALSNFEKLKFKGALLKSAGRIVAFTFGELLNNDMAVIHVEKADTEVQGAYPMINQKFCENEWGNVTYINREEDLGLPGLRKAKLSYNPVRLIEKYNATIKAQ